MKMELTARQKQDHKTFRAFADEEIAPCADQYDQEARLPSELFTKLAERGYLGAILPEAYAGHGMDLITYGLLNQELGRSCSSVRGLVMLQNMVAHTILRWGSESQKERWLTKIASGERTAAFALTEPDVGSDAGNIETKVAPAHGSYILNGRKKWITVGQLADLFLVFGQYDGKLCALLLEKDTPGLSIHPMPGTLGMRAAMLAELHLNECQVPEENMVGGVGLGLVPVAVSALNFGRYSVAWGCVGIAQACLEASIQHTSHRKQFGHYLKEHQLIQAMIADMVTNLKAARLLCLQSGYAMESGEPQSIMDILVAKYFASTAATQAALNAIQIHGAIGLSPDHPVQRYLRDAKVMEIIEGTTQIHQMKIAEHTYGWDLDA
jgi:alkylation response protein AidB-like acyl-CoA dehydrogenase